MKDNPGMKKNTALELAHDFFRLMKQFPRLKLKHTDGLTRSGQELLVMLVMNLDETEKALTVTEMSNLLQITPAGVTHLLNPLEETGFIERLPDPKDRRIVRIGLTDKGTQETAALISDVQENLVTMVNLLGEEDSRTFIRLVSRVIEHFSS
jgi:DNA-binding MarR family transcriptional regulator